MPFPATRTASRVINEAQDFAANFKSYALSKIAHFAANTVSVNELIDVYYKTIAAQDYFTRLVNFPNVEAYAKEQYADSGLEIIKEANSLLALISAVADKVAQLIPNDGTYLLTQKLTPTGIDTRQMTPSDTTDMRSVLQLLADEIIT